NSSYSWSLSRCLFCRLSFLFSPINPPSYCSFFNRTSKHLTVFLLSAFYHAFSVVACFLGSGKLYIWYPNNACFCCRKNAPLPPFTWGNKTLPFLKKSQP